MYGFGPSFQLRIHVTSLAVSTSGATPLPLRVDIIYGWSQAEGSSYLRPKLEVGQRVNRKYRSLRHFPLPNDGSDRQKGILLFGGLQVGHPQKYVFAGTHAMGQSFQLLYGN